MLQSIRADLAAIIPCQICMDVLVEEYSLQRPISYAWGIVAANSAQLLCWKYTLLRLTSYAGHSSRQICTIVLVEEYFPMTDFFSWDSSRQICAVTLEVYTAMTNFICRG